MILACKKRILGLVSALALFGLSVRAQPVPPKGTLANTGTLNDMGTSDDMQPPPAPVRGIKPHETMVFDVHPVGVKEFPGLPMDASKYSKIVPRIKDKGGDIKEGAPKPPVWTISAPDFKILRETGGAQQLPWLTITVMYTGVYKKPDGTGSSAAECVEYGGGQGHGEGHGEGHNEGYGEGFRKGRRRLFD
ncbi:hypothetical protein BDP27DRAFT_1450233 [Rhodocollybia butyracea]|uniref:Uncharacterized protein n=1 Tax=Rhodocollybia butyracea TaxID=206335 RepID=A0A9P5PGL8_9AGAR|nr:hypothetical protein BDP27DRAFT_1450233 [Rhodocollybia butyracea]